jgi:hypothetical protein
MVRRAGILMETPLPYFMTNKDWYYFDEKDFCYKLTEKATEKAKQSYKEFYELLEISK